MPMKDNVPTWVDPWLEHNFDLLSADLQQKILSERERWRVDAEAAQRAREALLDRLVASADVIASATIPHQPFYALDQAIDITARAITETLHGVPANEAHTSEFWTDTLAKHRERLLALVELGRVIVFDTNTGGAYVSESELLDWARCANLGLTRTGMVDFARYQGVTIGDAQRPEKTSKKKHDKMLTVIAALICLRIEPRSDVAISKQIETWTALKSAKDEIRVEARTVNNYIKEIGETLGLSRKELGLSGREDVTD